jgi:UDP-2,3-diacylglucosamine pyrophosphatase LpxH
MARFIRRIAEERTPDLDVELVINGDFVDFLAEPDLDAQKNPVFNAFRTDQNAALAAFEGIVAHVDGVVPPEARVFDALAYFVTKGRLTVLLGNHDVELALPVVRRALYERLSAGAASRIEFVMNGEAYGVGPCLIEHGNRYDGWNAVHLDDLRNLCSRLSRGETARAVHVQPGSRLVVEVMNPLKAKYRFIDLLKPETQAAIPLLTAIEPSVVRDIRRIVDTAEAYFRADLTDAVLREPTLSSAGRSALESLDDDAAAAAVHVNDRDETLKMLAEAEALYAPRATSALESMDSSLAERASSWFDAAKSLWRAASVGAVDDARLNLLRAGFIRQRQAIGDTFDFRKEDTRYEGAARALTTNGTRRVVIFGHTHLARSVRLGDCTHYINTGTWCPTMKLDDRWSDPATPEADAIAALKRFVADLARNQIGAWLREVTHCARVEYSTNTTGGVTGDVRCALCTCDDQGVLVVEDERVLAAS